jgi:hypothetical protein
MRTAIPRPKTRALAAFAFHGCIMSIRRLVSVLLLMAYLPACTSFQATTQPLPELTAPPKTVKKARITTVTGARIELGYIHVVNDTLYGTPEVPRPEPGPVAIAISDIKTVEVKKSDGTSTALLVGGIVLVIVVGAVAWSNSDWLDFSGWETEGQ